MNKYLVTFIVPVMDLEFDAYIPNCKKIGTIKKEILKYIKEVSENNFDVEFTDLCMIDKATGINYINDVFVKDTNIKNNTKIILV